MNKFWSFSFYFVFFAGVASFGPYRVLYYQSLDFTGAQIGLLVGIAPLITAVSLPFLTGLADKSNRHKTMMSALLFLLILLIFVYPLVTDFALMLMVAILLTVCFSAVMPFAASAIIYMLQGRRDLFGRMRLGGTIGFSIASTIIGALVESNGLRIGFWAAAIIMLGALIVSLKLEHTDKKVKKREEKGNARDLLKNPHFVLFLLLGFCGGISFTTINTYLFPYMQELGAGESIMGLALTFGTLVEIPVLFFMSNFVKRFKPYALVMFSIVMTGLRFFLLAIVPDPTLVLFVQLLNGFNHPLLTTAGAIYADEQAPEGYRATAQGLFNVAVSGIGAALGGFMGGLMFDSLGARGMYFVFGVMIVVVVIVVTFVRRFLPAENPVVIPEPTFET